MTERPRMDPWCSDVETRAVAKALSRRRTGAALPQLVADTGFSSIAVVVALESLTKEGRVRRVAEGEKRRTWRYFTTLSGQAHLRSIVPGSRQQ
ncbi:hypothetical protein BH10ACT1_BH10ACT1_27020 [soil metagenome]